LTPAQPERKHVSIGCSIRWAPLRELSVSGDCCASGGCGLSGVHPECRVEPPQWVVVEVGRVASGCVGQAVQRCLDLVVAHDCPEELPVDLIVVVPGEVEVVADQFVANGEECRPLSCAELAGGHPWVCTEG